MSQTERKADIAVIGGGASGMAAAVFAAESGCRTVILEHRDAPGKKIPATGNGRCNFTNTLLGTEYYRGEQPEFVSDALSRFGAHDAVSFFRRLGVWSTERNGYCYPRNMQAATIRSALLAELDRRKVPVRCGIQILSIKKEKDGFRIRTDSGSWKVKCCILATGGCADPKTGSDGSGYIFAQRFGHELIPPVPALVPLTSDAGWLKAVKGVRAKGRVRINVNNVPLASDCGEIQLTDYGISGIPVFQVSRYASRALSRGQRVSADLDFIPEAGEKALIRWLTNRLFSEEAPSSLEEILAGVLPGKLAAEITRLLHAGNIDLLTLSSDQKKEFAERTVKQLKRTRIAVTGTKGFEQAQVTAGGISTSEINSMTMESVLVKGLYFCGEILDIDGICGGYNLQWAWSSAYCAGKAAAGRCLGRK